MTTTALRWEQPDPNQSHFLYVDADDRIVGEVWRDGIRWQLEVRPDGVLVYGAYLTAEAAQKAVERAYA